MRTRLARGLLSVLAICLFLSTGVSASGELVRGLVVDRSDQELWLGLSSPVTKGTVFNVSLMPGGEIIARATSDDSTPDEPYVARARYRLLVPGAFVPIGAYVESTAVSLPDMDEPDGYRSVSTESESADRLSLRLGAFFPSDSQIRDETSGMWPTVQIGYRICDRKRLSAEIALSYFGNNGTFADGDTAGRRNLTAVPLTLDIRFPISRSDRSGWMARAGVGAYSIRDKRTVGDVSTARNVTTFGWQAGFGYVSSRGHSAELYYTDVSSTDFRGAVFSLGTRF